MNTTPDRCATVYALPGSNAPRACTLPQGHEGAHDDGREASLTRPCGGRSRFYDLSDEHVAIIRRALMDRVDRLHTLAGDVAQASDDGATAARPVLAEARRVGEVLDAIGGES
jgi:hypothetical protein